MPQGRRTLNRPFASCACSMSSEGAATKTVSSAYAASEPEGPPCRASHAASAMIAASTNQIAGRDPAVRQCSAVTMAAHDIQNAPSVRFQCARYGSAATRRSNSSDMANAAASRRRVLGRGGAAASAAASVRDAGSGGGWTVVCGAAAVGECAAAVMAVAVPSPAAAATLSATPLAGSVCGVRCLCWSCMVPPDSEVIAASISYRNSIYNYRISFLHRIIISKNDISCRVVGR